LNKKVLIPVITAVLLALGINLDQLGIDLEALLDGQSQTQVSQSDSKQTQQNEERVLVFNTGDSSSGAAPAAYKAGKKWSDTQPAINLHHIFEGEINRKGKPTGFHSRPGGVDPDGARIVRVRDKPNSKGVYTAMIEVRDGNQWKEKFSSFFPDNLSATEVIEIVLNAYRNSSDKNRQPWQGPSGLGFDIQGYTLSRGDINTAFPVYRKD